jgi:hypothetical protein
VDRKPQRRRKPIPRIAFFCDPMFRARCGIPMTGILTRPVFLAESDRQKGATTSTSTANNREFSAALTGMVNALVGVAVDAAVPLAVVVAAPFQLANSPLRSRQPPEALLRSLGQRHHTTSTGKRRRTVARGGGKSAKELEGQIVARARRRQSAPLTSTPFTIAYSVALSVLPRFVQNC